MVSIFQRFPMVTFCCFCYSLRKGNVIIAFYYIIFFFLTCSHLLWNPCYTNILTQNCPCRNIFWILVLIFSILNLIGMVAAVMFLLGMSYAFPNGVSYFLYCHFVAAVLMTLFMNITATAHATYYHVTNSSTSCYVGRNICLCLFLTVVYISIALYCISMVISYRDGYDLNFPDIYESVKPKYAQARAEMGALMRTERTEGLLDETKTQGPDKTIDNKGLKDPCAPCGKKQAVCVADGDKKNVAKVLVHTKKTV